MCSLLPIDADITSIMNPERHIYWRAISQSPSFLHYQLHPKTCLQCPSSGHRATILDKTKDDHLELSGFQ